MLWGYPWQIWSLRLTSNAAGAHAEQLPGGVGRSPSGVGGSRGRSYYPSQILHTTARTIPTIGERPAALGCEPSPSLARLEEAAEGTR
jgi:hypothetical protein